MKLQFIPSVAVVLLNSNMKLSYIFSLLPLVAANDGHLYEGRHHLRRALTAEGVGESCNAYTHNTQAEASAACSGVQCANSDEHCEAVCTDYDILEPGCPCDNYCAKCVPKVVCSDYDDNHSECSNLVDCYYLNGCKEVPQALESSN